MLEEKENKENFEGQEKKEKQSLAIPAAIVFAGVIIAGAILLKTPASISRNSIFSERDDAGTLPLALAKDTIAEEVGLDKDAFSSCLSSGRHAVKIENDYQSGVKAGVSGTPHSVVINIKTGKTYELGGAQPSDVVRATIQNALSGDNEGISEISLDPVLPTEHIFGNPNAEVFVVEYSDPECPFCKRFHETMNAIMAEYNEAGRVAWVYRHFPIDSLHSRARKESEAFECAAELGGNAKFWEYANKLFEITPSNNELNPKYL